MCTRFLAALIAFGALAGCSDDSSDASSGGAGGSAGAAGSAGSDAGTENPADYLDRPLREQVTALESGAITSSGLTQAYLDRIAVRDPNIHAILTLDPSAADKAASLDQERGQGAPLQGAVILVKDNIDTQGLRTSAGSLAMENNVPAADAFPVSRLHAANALVLGKTNLSEWANFRGTQSTSGWSSLGGQTSNGADATKNPCGSSSGSGAAVAAGLASAALGTETDGSIVCPAAVNGVVGFKPTVGLVSRAGVIPISDAQDTVGPMTRTVGDAARLLSAIAGPDPADPATLAIPSGLDLDFETALDGASLQGKRLGVVSVGVQPPVQALFDAERAKIEAAGATVIDVVLDKASFSNDEITVLLHEFKAGLNAYLAAHPTPGQPTTLAELIAYNEANAATVMPHFGQELFVAAEATTGLDDPSYLAAKQNAKAKAGTNGIAAVLAADNLDALIAPTGDVAWITSYTTGDPFGTITFISAPAAVAGYPHLTVPMGMVDGLPAGLSIFAGQWQDAEVLALGHAYESLPK
jgi:amidase